MGKSEPLTRSEVMSRIRRRDTAPELTVRRLLHACGARYRVDFHIPGVGRVDIAFTRRKVAIFIDGCFWHQCPAHSIMPKTNQVFWKPKLARNRERDLAQSIRLEDLGWTAVRIWEHEIREDPGDVTQRILKLTSHCMGPAR